MKIVINAEFGGFSLSPLATKEYYAKKGRTAYFFDGQYDAQTRTTTYIPIDINSGCWMIYAFDIPNPKPNEDWNEHYLCNRPDNRTDPDLIEVVEKLGEKANGTYAHLKVIEIPDGIDYQIDEYDGWESVHEVHRSWN